MTQDEGLLRDFRAAAAQDLTDLATLHDREVDAAGLDRLRAAVGEGELLRLRLVNEDSRAALFLLDEALRGLPAEIDGTLLDDLAADYADIYLTYGLRASPNESVWLDEDNLAMQAPMFEVRELYRRHGLQVPDWRRRADDHLVHELQFLAHLLDPESGDTLGEAAAFLDEHLLLWLPDFSARVAQRCATPFYAGVAAVTAAYLDELRELLERVLGQPRTPREEVEERRRRARESEPAPSAFVPGSAPTW
jgi:TorA maturation chaperone TorD